MAAVVTARGYQRQAERDCPGCGRTFPLTIRNQQKKWCSIRCYNRSYHLANKPKRKAPPPARTDSAGHVVGSDAWAATLLQEMR